MATLLIETSARGGVVALARDGVIVKQDPKQLVMSIAGMHLLYFAMPEVSARLLGRDVFSRELIEERARIVCTHLRRLCGAPTLNGTHVS